MTEKKKGKSMEDRFSMFQEVVNSVEHLERVSSNTCMGDAEIAEIHLRGDKDIWRVAYVFGIIEDPSPSNILNSSLLYSHCNPVYGDKDKIMTPIQDIESYKVIK